MLLFHTLMLQFLDLADHRPWGDSAIRALYYLPVRFLWDGEAVVILFFVLSGFVLSLPYYAAHDLPYGRYLVRRFFRIYIPYIVAIAVGLILRSLVDRGPVEGFPPAIGRTWSAPITSKTIVDHLLLIYRTDQTIDPVTWSLTAEMRRSIVFPLLMVIVLRTNAAVALALGFATSRVGLLLHRLLTERTSWSTDVFLSSQYVIPFVIGALVAKHRVDLIDRLVRARPIGRIAWLALGFGIYNYFSFIEVLIRRVVTIESPLIRITCLSIGSATLIVWALGSPAVSSALKTTPARFLGRVSYSLYLYHLLILTTLMRIASGRVSPWVVDVLAIGASLLVAPIAYRFVEAPATAMGRRLTARRNR